MQDQISITSTNVYPIDSIPGIKEVPPACLAQLPQIVNTSPSIASEHDPNKYVAHFRLSSMINMVHIVIDVDDKTSDVDHMDSAGVLCESICVFVLFKLD